MKLSELPKREVHPLDREKLSDVLNPHKATPAEPYAVKPSDIRLVLKMAKKRDRYVFAPVVAVAVMEEFLSKNPGSPYRLLYKEFIGVFKVPDAPAVAWLVTTKSGTTHYKKDLGTFIEVEIQWRRQILVLPLSVFRVCTGVFLRRKAT